MNIITRHILSIVILAAASSVSANSGVAVKDGLIIVPTPNGYSVVERSSVTHSVLSDAARKADAAFLPTKENGQPYSATEVKEVGYLHVHVLQEPKILTLQDWLDFKREAAAMLKARRSNSPGDQDLGVLHESERLLLTGYVARTTPRAQYDKIVGVQAAVFASNKVLLIEGVRPNRDEGEAGRLLELVRAWGSDIASNNTGAKEPIWTDGERTRYHDLLKSNPQEAFTIAKRDAENGVISAELVLGHQYLTGNGTTRDHSEARKWFSRAAHKGHPMAQYYLGIIYGKGLGTEKDFNEAFRWFKLSAEGGYDSGQQALGQMYANGRGVAQSHELAAKWLLKAAEQGHKGAQANIGAYYFKGTGVKKDAKQAVKWLKKASDQGQPQAAHMLGLMYEHGDGVDRNLDEAKRFYGIGASKGLKESTAKLEKIGNR